VTLRPGHGGAWHQATGAPGHRVRFEAHCLFAASGEELVSPDELRSRTRTELTLAADRRRGAAPTKSGGYGLPFLLAALRLGTADATVSERTVITVSLSTSPTAPSRPSSTW